MNNILLLLFLRLFPCTDGVGVFLSASQSALTRVIASGWHLVLATNFTSGWAGCPSHSTFAISLAREIRAGVLLYPLFNVPRPGIKLDFINMNKIILLNHFGQCVKRIMTIRRTYVDADLLDVIACSQSHWEKGQSQTSF
jgi:hypothetical protein